MHRGVELPDVLNGRVLVERRGIGIAELGERFGAVLDELLEATVDLFGVLAVCPVIVPFRLLHAGQEVHVLLLEEVELAVDQLGEAARHGS